MYDLESICKSAKQGSYTLGALDESEKNIILKAMAQALIDETDGILEANIADLEANSSKPSHFLDRLKLTPERIADMSRGILQIANLPDPVGVSLGAWQVESGLKIEKISVPIGVIGIIYESRPNVTSDAAALCLKSGNAVVLKGGSDAINSNKEIVKVLKKGISSVGFSPDFLQIIEDTDRETTLSLMKMDRYIDLLIPRGSAGLIRSVVENSTIPVIETGTGNCHIYLEESGDINMAKNILINAKTSRPSVCNAAETLLIDEKIANVALPILAEALQNSGTEMVGCEKSVKISDKIKAATDEDFFTEFLSLKISIKIIGGIHDAISHINKYGSRHSEAIISSDEKKVELFFKNVDSAALYHNASTRFTDGGEFGFGAEMGISTQKLHARGPVGLRELTSYKYLVRGNGNIR